MSTSVAAFRAQTTSQKLLLAWLSPSVRMLAWTVYSGSIYQVSTQDFVVTATQTGVPLTAKTSLAAVTAAGEWFYDPTTKTCYVWSTGAVDPSTVYTLLTFRICLANGPISLPYNLQNGGYVVPYSSILTSASGFSVSMDAQNTGISLEGSGNIGINNDGSFNSRFDKYLWENQRATVWSYSPALDVTDATIIFDGSITNKHFSLKSISWDVANFVYQLRASVPLPLMTVADGTLAPAQLGQPKRRLYGRTNTLLQGADKTLTGYPLSGSFAGTVGSKVFTGTGGALVADEVSPGDTLGYANLTNTVTTLSRVNIGITGQMTISLTWNSSLNQMTIAGAGGSTLDFSGLAANDSIGLFASQGIPQNNGVFTVVSQSGSAVVVSRTGWTTGEATASLTIQAAELLAVQSPTATAMTLANPLTVTYAALVPTLAPAVPSRHKNRKWLVAHHAISAPVITITDVFPYSSQLQLSTVTDLHVGDWVTIDAQDYLLTTISGLLVGTAQNLQVSVTSSSVFTRKGIQSLTLGGVSFPTLTSLATFTNDMADGCSLLFTPTAERDATVAAQVAGSSQWLNGQRLVCSSTGGFGTLKPRDWVSADGVHWYEVEENCGLYFAIIRQPFAQTTTTTAAAQSKQPNYLADSSNLVCDAYGINFDGTVQGSAGGRVITGSDVVKHLLLEQGLAVDDSSFNQAAEDSTQQINYTLPRPGGSQTKVVQDVIGDINNSIFGNLYHDANWLPAYKVLNAGRLAGAPVVVTVHNSPDGDLQIANGGTIIIWQVTGSYGFKDWDEASQTASFHKTVVESSQDIVNSGRQLQTEARDWHFADLSSATIMSQRLLLFKSLSTCEATIKTNLEYLGIALNDLVSLQFPEGYHRLGQVGTDQALMGICSGIQHDGLTITITVNNLGNIFNRVAVVAPNIAAAYATATTDDLQFNGYLTDQNGLVGGHGDTFSANLIG